MRKVNINRDVESRRTIAASHPTEEKPIVEPVKTEENNAQSEELQGSENDQKQVEPFPSGSKRGRKTQGDAQEIPV